MALCGCRVTRSRWNLIAVSLSFFVLFSAYNPLQNLATSLFPQGLGNQSLAVLYATVAVTVCLAPSMVETFGSRVTMMLGAWMYVAYLASVIHIVPGVVLAMSTVIGFGAAILWVALGVFITQNSSKRTYGANVGFFWSVFQLCQVFGNLIGFFVTSQQSQNVLFITFTIIGAVGSLGLLLLRPPQRDDEAGLPPTDRAGGGAYVAVTPEGTIQHTAAGTAAATLPSATDATRPTRSPVTCAAFWSHAAVAALAAVRLLGTPRMLLLLPLMFFSGMELSFWTGA